MGPEILFLVLAGLVLIGPLVHILVSSRVRGGARLGWVLAYLLFWLVGYIVFLVATKKTVDPEESG